MSSSLQTYLDSADDAMGQAELRYFAEILNIFSASQPLLHTRPMSLGSIDSLGSEYEAVLSPQLNESVPASAVIRVLKQHETLDFLGLARNDKLLERLAKYTSNADSKAPTEVILFSAVVTKVNKSGTSQLRVLLLTDLALYNLIPKSLVIKRRINIDSVDSVSVAQPPSQHFAVHVRDEYDYLYATHKRIGFLETLSRAFETRTGRQLTTQLSDPNELHLRTKSKKLMHKQKEMVDQRGESNPIWGIRKARSLVRGKKRFVVTDTGVKLDLTYITDRIIAMGFPSVSIEGLYRNPYREVYRHLETKHADCYRVYNLCSERSYASSKFHNRVACFPFDDHNPPPLRLLLAICVDIQRHLNEGSENVVAIHCKAGKGRTGTVIAAYLLYANAVSSAQQGLELFGNKRTSNSKGVTIPSQRRFVYYWECFLRTCYVPRRPFSYSGRPIVLKHVVMSRIPRVSRFGVHLYVKIYNMNQVKLFDSRDGRKGPAKTYRPGEATNIKIDINKALYAEFLVVFSHSDGFTGSSERLCWFWLHSSFIRPGILSLARSDIDRACKKPKIFPDDFAIHALFDAPLSQGNETKSSPVHESSLNTALVKGEADARGSDGAHRTRRVHVHTRDERGRIHSLTKRQQQGAVKKSKLYVLVEVHRAKSLSVDPDDYPFIRALLLPMDLSSESSNSTESGEHSTINPDKALFLAESAPLQRITGKVNEWRGYRSHMVLDATSQNEKQSQVETIVDDKSNDHSKSIQTSRLILQLCPVSSPNQPIGEFTLPLYADIIQQSGNVIHQWLPFVQKHSNSESQSNDYRRHDVTSDTKREPLATNSESSADETDTKDSTLKKSKSQKTTLENMNAKKKRSSGSEALIQQTPLVLLTLRFHFADESCNIKEAFQSVLKRVSVASVG